MTASRKLAHDKVFFFKYFQKKAFNFFLKGITIKKIALNLYTNINELVYERLTMKVFSMTKKIFLSL